MKILRVRERTIVSREEYSTAQLTQQSRRAKDVVEYQPRGCIVKSTQSIIEACNALAGKDSSRYSL